MSQIIRKFGKGGLADQKTQALSSEQSKKKEKETSSTPVEAEKITAAEPGYYTNQVELYTPTVNGWDPNGPTGGKVEYSKGALGVLAHDWNFNQWLKVHPEFTGRESELKGQFNMAMSDLLSNRFDASKYDPAINLYIDAMHQTGVLPLAYESGSYLAPYDILKDLIYSIANRYYRGYDKATSLKAMLEDWKNADFSKKVKLVRETLAALDTGLIMSKFDMSRTNIKDAQQFKNYLLQIIDALAKDQNNPDLTLSDDTNILGHQLLGLDLRQLLENLAQIDEHKQQEESAAEEEAAQEAEQTDKQNETGQSTTKEDTTKASTTEPKLEKEWWGKTYTINIKKLKYLDDIDSYIESFKRDLIVLNKAIKTVQQLGEKILKRQFNPTELHAFHKIATALRLIREGELKNKDLKIFSDGIYTYYLDLTTTKPREIKFYRIKNNNTGTKNKQGGTLIQKYDSGGPATQGAQDTDTTKIFTDALQEALLKAPQITRYEGTTISDPHNFMWDQNTSKEAVLSYLDDILFKRLPGISTEHAWFAKELWKVLKKNSTMDKQLLRIIGIPALIGTIAPYYNVRGLDEAGQRQEIDLKAAYYMQLVRKQAASYSNADAQNLAILEGLSKINEWKAEQYANISEAALTKADKNAENMETIAAKNRAIADTNTENLLAKYTANIATLNANDAAKVENWASLLDAMFTRYADKRDQLKQSRIYSAINNISNNAQRQRNYIALLSKNAKNIFLGSVETTLRKLHKSRDEITDALTKAASYYDEQTSDMYNTLYDEVSTTWQNAVGHAINSLNEAELNGQEGYLDVKNHEFFHPYSSVGDILKTFIDKYLQTNPNWGTSTVQTAPPTQLFGTEAAKKLNGGTILRNFKSGGTLSYEDRVKLKAIDAKNKEYITMLKEYKKDKRQSDAFFQKHLLKISTEISKLIEKAIAL